MLLSFWWQNGDNDTILLLYVFHRGWEEEQRFEFNKESWEAVWRHILLSPGSWRVNPMTSVKGSKRGWKKKGRKRKGGPPQPRHLHMHLLLGHVQARVGWCTYCFVFLCHFYVCPCETYLIFNSHTRHHWVDSRARIWPFFQYRTDTRLFSEWA